jgi:hypothetical protein
VRIHGEVIIGEHKAIKCILGDGVEEDRAPSTVERGRLLEDEREQVLDVDDGDGLSVKLSLLRILVLGDALIRRVGPSAGSICAGKGSLSLGGGSLSSSSSVLGRPLGVLDCPLKVGVGGHGARRGKKQHRWSAGVGGVGG